MKIFTIKWYNQFPLLFVEKCYVQWISDENWTIQIVIVSKMSRNVFDRGQFYQNIKWKTYNENNYSFILYSKLIISLKCFILTSNENVPDKHIKHQFRIIYLYYWLQSSNKIFHHYFNSHFPTGCFIHSFIHLLETCYQYYFQFEHCHSSIIDVCIYEICEMI